MARATFDDASGVDRLDGSIEFPSGLVTVGTAGPTDPPADGVPFFINTTGPVLYFWDGSDWTELAND